MKRIQGIEVIQGSRRRKVLRGIDESLPKFQIPRSDEGHSNVRSSFDVGEGEILTHLREQGEFEFQGLSGYRSYLNKVPPIRIT